MSTSISTLLQVTATPQPSRANSSDHGAASDFQNLLAEASNSAKQSSDEAPEPPVVATVDEKPKEEPQHDATSHSDEQDLPTGAEEVGSQSTSEDEQPQAEDSLELSEIASILLELPSDEETVIFQASVTSPFESEVLHVTAAEASTEEVEQQLQNAITLPAAESEGESANEPHSHPSEHAATVEIVEKTATLIAEEQASQPIAAVEVQEATQLDSRSQQSGSNESKRQPNSQLLQSVDGVGNPAATDPSIVEATQSATETTSEPSGEHSESPKPLANTLSEVTEPITTANLAVEQNTQTEVAATAVELAPSAEGSTTPVESSGTKVPEAAAETRADAAPATESEPVPTADRVRFVQRVSRAFQSARSSDGEIQLKLSPPELGTLRLSISVEQGVVSAKVETETAAARNILLDNLPVLRERLAEQEIRVEKFDVDVGRDGEQTDQQSRFDNEDRQHHRLPHQNKDITSAGTSASEENAEVTNSQKAQVVSSDSLDVSI